MTASKPSPETIVHDGDSALVIGRAAGVALRVKVSGAEAAGLHEGEERPAGWTREAAFVIPENTWPF